MAYIDLMLHSINTTGWSGVFCNRLLRIDIGSIFFLSYVFEFHDLR